MRKLGLILALLFTAGCAQFDSASTNGSAHYSLNIDGRTSAESCVKLGNSKRDILWPDGVVRLSDEYLCSPLSECSVFAVDAHGFEICE